MKLAGFAVHVLTGLGAVCALFAVEAVFAAAWSQAFMWLGAAFLIDGIDGPMARAVNVMANLPRYSGERIDLVIDYITYVFVPVLMLLMADRLPSGAGAWLGGLVLLSSLFHFSDVESKSEDLSFVGFPAIWNLVAFYIFAMDMGPIAASVLIVVCVLLTFVPLHWVHPLRVVEMRPVTFVATVAWSAAALWSVMAGFPPPWPAQLVLAGVAIYGIALSLWLSRGLLR